MKIFSLFFLTIVMYILISCMHVGQPDEFTDLKYKNGQCVMVIDSSSEEETSPYIVRIEGATKSKYIYRWWLEDMNQWGYDDSTEWENNTSIAFGTFLIFDKTTKGPVPCPTCDDIECSIYTCVRQNIICSWRPSK